VPIRRTFRTGHPAKLPGLAFPKSAENLENRVKISSVSALRARCFGRAFGVNGQIKLVTSSEDLLGPEVRASFMGTERTKRMDPRENPSSRSSRLRGFGKRVICVCSNRTGLGVWVGICARNSRVEFIALVTH
jgi:hypothetical protein